MGATVYQKCSKALIDYKGKIVTLEELKSIVIKFIGSQSGTINTALHTMGATNLIKDLGNCRFEVL